MSHLILEYGSVARRDSNINSDRDLVCIWSGKKPNYQSINDKYPDIMYYSLNNIKRMKEKGSLFLTHLDIDSKYLEGDKKLVDFFSGYKPQKKQILTSLIATRNSIKQINWFPNSKVGKLWLYDVLYVALRNFIYCKNALQEIYLFSYQESIKQLNLTNAQKLQMLFLRDGKYLYRRREMKNIDNLDIHDIEDVCSVILEERVTFRAGGSTNWHNIKKKDYWAERFIERAILNKEYSDVRFLEKIKKHNYNKYQIKSHITKIINANI